MADYKLFVQFLGREDDLVTEELKLIAALNKKKQRLADTYKTKMEDADSKFRGDMAQLYLMREALEEDEDVCLARNEYESQLKGYTKHWADRKNKLDTYIKNDHRTKRVCKIIIISTLIAIVTFILGIAVTNMLETSNTVKREYIESISYNYRYL